MINLRKDYDVEIKTMFLELNRVKEELTLIKHKTFGTDNLPLMCDNEVNQEQNSNQVSGSLGNNNWGVIKKEEGRRYEPHSSSVGGSGSLYEF